MSIHQISDLSSTHHYELSAAELRMLSGTATMEQLLQTRLRVPGEQNIDLVTAWMHEHAQGLYYVSSRGDHCVVYFLSGSDRAHLERYIHDLINSRPV